MDASHLRVTADANQKGGTGKTTTTLGLAAALAARGRRVVVVDADPQHSATAALGVDPDDPDTPTLFDLLAKENRGAPLTAGIVETPSPPGSARPRSATSSCSARPSRPCPRGSGPTTS